MNARTQVRWSDEELNLLADEIALLRIEDPSPSMQELFMLAQASLPDNRQRKTHISQVDGLTERVCLSLANLLSPKKQDTDLSSVIKAAPTNLLLITLAERVTAAINGLSDRLGALERYPEKPRPKPDQKPDPKPDDNGAPPRPRLPVIAVIGLMSDQFRQLRERCQKVAVELRLVDSTSSRPTVPPGADYCINWVRFSRHNYESDAIRVVGPVNYFRHRGGLEQMAVLVADIVAGKARPFRGNK